MSAECSRRAFLATGSCFAATLVLAGLPAELAAAPLREIEALAVTPIERTYPLPATDAVSIDRVAQIILVRSQNHVYAFALSCPHQNAAVKWLPRDSRFQCTKHDSKYTEDGVYMSGRSTRNLDRFVVHQNGAALVVSLDKVIQADKDPAGWAAAVVSV